MQLIENIFTEFHIPKGSFRRNVLILMTGTIVAQAISIVISPVLTRLYTPSDFGVFAFFTSLVSIIGIVATGRFELAIMLPDNDEDAVNLLVLSIAICFGITAIACLVGWLFNPELVRLFGNSSVSSWIYLAPFSILFMGLYQALSCWASRKKQYRTLSVSRVSQAIASVSLNLIFGVIGFGAGGLIGAILVGQGVSTAILFLQAKNDVGSDVRRVVTVQRIHRNAIKYKDFPLINSWHALMDTCQAGGIVFIISYFYGDYSLGLYSLTLRALRMPLSLIGSSVSQVFYQRASELYSVRGDLQDLVRKTVFRLIAVAFPIFLCIFFFAPWIFRVVFGKDWQTAGVYAQILSPWLFLHFIVSPVSQIPIVVRNQKAGFVVSFLCHSAAIVALAASAFMGKEVKYSLVAFSLVGSLALFLYGLWILWISKNHKREQYA